MKITDKKIDWFIVLSIVIVYGAVWLYSAGDYGITIDEHRNYYIGERTFHYFLHGDKEYLNFGNRKLYDFESKDHPVFQPGINDIFDVNAVGHPPGPSVLAAAACKVFYRTLGVLEPLTAHRSIILILNVFLIGVIYFFALEAYNRITAIFAALSLALYPHFIGYAHSQIKDIPQTCFFSFTIWTSWKGVSNKDWRWVTASGILWGLAIASKMNAAFIPVIILPWFLAMNLGKETRSQLASSSSYYKTSLLAYPFLALGVLILSWPRLWQNTFSTFQTWFSFYKKVGTVPGASHWNPAAVKFVMAATPAAFLILLVLGIFAAVENLREGEKNKPSLLILLWLAIPVLRVSVPYSNFWGGIRHYIEFVPALCLLVGIGSSKVYSYLYSRLADKNSESLAQAVSLAVLTGSCILVLYSNVKSHPYQNLYFSELLGGLKGAVAIDAPATGDNYGLSLKPGVEWLNKYAEKNAQVSCIDTSFNFLFTYSNLRDDLKSIPVQNLDRGYVLLRCRTKEDHYLDRIKEKQPPIVHTIESGGVPILKIMKVGY